MNIAVFCSSSNQIKPCFFEDASVLGHLIGTHGHSLVNGGAGVGLMEATACTAKGAGAKITGIIPKLIHESRLASESVDELIVTESMYDRKYMLRQKSDAFIALPGGFGTLDEIIEVITLKQLKYHNKPIVFINTANYYSLFFQQVEKSIEEGFALPSYRKLFHVAKDPEDAISYIESYIHEDVELKWMG